MMFNRHDDDALPHGRLPVPPSVFSTTWAVDMDVYVRFMRALRQSVITKPEQKVLVAVTTVATQMADELDEADVALTLVQLGLRMPRGAFPAAFVNRALDGHMRHVRRGGTFDPALSELLSKWWGLPVSGAMPTRGPSYTARIASIPTAFKHVATRVDMQNLLGLCPEPVL